MKFKCAFVVFSLAISGCAGMAATAEEYYSIGMAYFEMGKYEEAEKWLNRAGTADKTKVASEYNLGRIAFETKRYTDAAKHFEGILKRDPNNALALKAAAYTRIKTGEIELAEQHYAKLLSLAPESADDGYNYAMVLYAMKKYAEAESVLSAYPFALEDNSEAQLLYARAQNAQGKVEAADAYAKWLAGNSDARVRWEYAKILESQELYARALEEYRSALEGLPANSTDPSGAELRFAVARVLLVAESASDAGITELEAAVGGGYRNIEAMEELLNDKRIIAVNKDSIRKIINDARQAAGSKAQVEGSTDNPAQ